MIPVTSLSLHSTSILTVTIIIVSHQLNNLRYTFHKPSLVLLAPTTPSPYAAMSTFLSLPLSLAFLLLSYFLSLPTASHSAPSSLYPPSSPVVSLTSRTFPSALSSEHLIHMVQFYSPKSGKCKSIADDYISAAKTVGEMAVVAAVDCLQEKALCEEEGVYVDEEIPVVKVYSGVAGKAAARYATGFTAKGLTQYLFNAIPAHHITLVNSRNYKPLSSSSPPRVLLFTDKPASSTLYRALSHSLYHRLHFTQISAKENKLVRQYEVKTFPTLIVEWREGDEIANQKFVGEMKFVPISKWMAKYASASSGTGSSSGGDGTGTADGGASGAELSGLQQLTDQSCMEAVCIESNALCVIAILTPGSPSFSTYIERLRTIELSHYGSLFRFAWLDGAAQFSFISSSFAMEPQEYPQLVLLAANKKRYTPYIGSYTHESITEWLDITRSGKAKSLMLESGEKAEMKRLEGDTDVCGEQKKEEQKKRKDAQTAKEQEEEMKRREQQPRPIPTRAQASNAASTVLTSSNFTSTVLDSPYAWLLLFYSASSPLFSLSPVNRQLVGTDWHKVAKKCKNMVRFGSVDVDTEEELAKQFAVNVGTEATILYFNTEVRKDESTAQRYEGDMPALSLYGFALSLLSSDHIIELKGDAHLFSYMATPPTSSPRVLLFSSAPAPTIPPLYQAFSSSYSPSLLFAIARSTDTQLTSKFNVQSFPAVFFLSLDGQSKAQLAASPYIGALTYDALSEFAEQVLTLGLTVAQQQQRPVYQKVRTKEMEEELKKRDKQKKEEEERKRREEEEKKEEEAAEAAAGVESVQGATEAVPSCSSSSTDGAVDSGMCTAPPSTESAAAEPTERRPRLLRQKGMAALNHLHDDDLPPHNDL